VIIIGLNHKNIMIYNKFNIENKTVIITGGTGHLGTAISKQLMHCRAKTHILSRNAESQQELKEFAANNNLEKYLNLHVIDIFEHKKVNELIDKIITKESTIDVLINNAYDNSLEKRVSIDKIDSQDLSNEIGKSIAADFSISRKVHEVMKLNNGGSIIFTGSIFGSISSNYKMYTLLNNQPSIHTSIDKSSVIQMVKALAADWGKLNIRVNSISPGFFPKKRGKDRPDYLLELNSRIPMDRIGLADEIVGAYIFLASEASSYLTGQNIIIDGGYSIW